MELGEFSLRNPLPGEQFIYQGRSLFPIAGTAEGAGELGAPGKKEAVREWITAGILQDPKCMSLYNK